MTDNYLWQQNLTYINYTIDNVIKKKNYLKNL